jgi:hypothetical protein
MMTIANVCRRRAAESGLYCGFRTEVRNKRVAESKEGVVDEKLEGYIRGCCSGSCSVGRMDGESRI